ncbi:MAG: hypothetical protein ACLGHT_07465 [Acidimicrobiia bacterium]
MDVIPWVIGLVAGIALPLRYAVAIGTSSSIALRVYQYFLPEPKAWGRDLPEDLFGATAMILLTLVLTWVGSILRARRVQRAEAA